MALIPPTCGRRRGVVIGVGNRGTQRALLGPAYDAKNFAEMLERHQYEVRLMFEREVEKNTDNVVPYKKEILMALQWLVEGAKAGDSLVLYFSGHGERIPCTHCKGHDVAILTTGEEYIRSTELNALFASLPCRLFAVFDCCHGASILRLPHVLSDHKMPKHKHKHDCPLLTHILSHPMPLHTPLHASPSSPPGILIANGGAQYGEILPLFKSSSDLTTDATLPDCKTNNNNTIGGVNCAGTNISDSRSRSELSGCSSASLPSTSSRPASDQPLAAPVVMPISSSYTRCVIALAPVFGSRARECAAVKGMERQSEMTKAWSELPGEGFGIPLSELIATLHKTMGKYGWRKYRPRLHKRGPVMLGSAPYALEQPLGL